MTDPKDAVVPLAKVTLVEEATSVSSTTVTNDKGQYSFPVLNPSTYDAGLSKRPASKSWNKKASSIVTQTANTQDAKLDIGQVTETIDVTAEAELLDYCQKPPRVQTSIARSWKICRTSGAIRSCWRG